MAKFIIEPHFRLQEWIAHDKGYFTDEGLDYEFRELIKSSDGKHHDKGDKVGAMQSFEAGRKADVSCACHWTINVAASKGLGRMANEVYSVSPAGIFVQPDSKIKRRRISPACRSRSAISPAATTPRSRRSSSSSRRTRSISLTRTACCSRAWTSCSTARRRRCICSAGLITSPSNSATARSSTPPS